MCEQMLVMISWNRNGINDICWIIFYCYLKIVATFTESQNGD
jgi:hypothetical protein